MNGCHDIVIVPRHLNLATVQVLAFILFGLQVISGYIDQGQLMRPPLNESSSIQIPSSMFSAVDSAAVLISIVILHGFVFPKWLLRDTNFKLSHLRRIGLGMIVAVCSLVAAFLVEFYRRQGHLIPVNVHDSQETTYISRMSVFYQVPQYVLAGLAEVLVMVSGELKRPPFNGCMYNTSGLL